MREDDFLKWLEGSNIHPGFSEKAKTPFFFSFWARAAAKRIFAVLDCAYASHGLYSLPSFLLS